MEAKRTEPVTIISLRELNLGTPEPQPKESKTFTVEDTVETIGFRRFHIALFLIMGGMGVAEAMESTLIAVVSPVIRCEWQLENGQGALVTTMVFFGYMVFSILFGLLADRYGRWKILLISFLWGAYFSLLTSFSPSYIWFVFLRTMVGCGVSGHAQELIIKTEFLPTKYRGYMLLLSQVFWLAGSLLIIDLASVVIPTIGWHWLTCITSIPGIILIMAFMFIPESAWFSVSTGNTQAALVTLERIAKMNRSVMLEGKLVEPILKKEEDLQTYWMLNIYGPHYRSGSYGWASLFAYYGVILASAELLERDLACGLRSESEAVVTVGVSEESQSPCHCQVFAPSDYQTMIISTIGEIARKYLSIGWLSVLKIAFVIFFLVNPLTILGINFLGRRLSLSITMCVGICNVLGSGPQKALCVACGNVSLWFPSVGLIGFLFMLRALVASSFNTIYIYTAEVSFGDGVGSIKVGEVSYLEQVFVYRSRIPGFCVPHNDALFGDGDRWLPVSHWCEMVAPFISQVQPREDMSKGGCNRKTAQKCREAAPGCKDVALGRGPNSLPLCSDLSLLAMRNGNPPELAAAKDESEAGPWVGLIQAAPEDTKVLSAPQKDALSGISLVRPACSEKNIMLKGSSKILILFLDGQTEV
ncbi:hypothetical protein EI555_009440 [Monodon monoceros]|uniref:Major facilitator superfamily (MFS) profile domain-containing protein n=1 Tax=Monodon monoceros TaxID=40151 RepID=A0A4U1FPX8_MONMO|nr:hypothetical protein EI555_009440 [Monodon monoceros]